MFIDEWEAAKQMRWLAGTSFEPAPSLLFHVIALLFWKAEITMTDINWYNDETYNAQLT